MKKALILTSFLVAALSFGAFAGPLLGLSFAPQVGSQTAIHFGWQSQNDWAAFITKDNLFGLYSWQGFWDIGALWTPQLWENVNLRAGGEMVFLWISEDFHYNHQTFYPGITYIGPQLRLGAERWITDQVGIYGDIVIGPRFNLSPQLGIEINFFLPTPSETAPQTQ